MKAITKYVADDGVEFIDEAKCREHDALIVEVAEVMRPLGERYKHGDTCDYENGAGYVQHTTAAVADVRGRLLHIAQRFTDHKWIRQTLEKGSDAHASWAGAAIGESCPLPLREAWWRISTMDKQGREWGQPYYADHPAEAKQVCLRAGP